MVQNYTCALTKNNPCIKTPFSPTGDFFSSFPIIFYSLPCVADFGDVVVLCVGAELAVPVVTVAAVPADQVFTWRFIRFINRQERKRHMDGFTD